MRMVDPKIKKEFVVPVGANVLEEKLNRLSSWQSHGNQDPKNGVKGRSIQEYKYSPFVTKWLDGNFDNPSIGSFTKLDQEDLEIGSGAVYLRDNTGARWIKPLSKVDSDKSKLFVAEFSELLQSDINQTLLSVLMAAFDQPLAEKDEVLRKLLLQQWKQKAMKGLTGTLVYVPKHTVSHEVLRIVHDVSSIESGSSSHLIVYLEEGAQLSLVEEFLDKSGLKQRHRLHGDNLKNDSSYNTAYSTGTAKQDDPRCVGALTQVYVGKQAQLKMATVIQSSSSSQNLFVGRILGHVYENATWQYVPVGIGAQQVQLGMHQVCVERGAEILTKGVVQTESNQRYEIRTETIHEGSRTSSNMEILAAADDQSRIVFNGRIQVNEGTKSVEAHQKSKNLLASSSAEIVTEPKLDISTDDLKCSHGASVSSVQDDQLYYLQTRGISRDLAEQMILQGFARPVLDLIFCEEVRRRLIEAVGGSLDDDADVLKVLDK